MRVLKSSAGSGKTFALVRAWLGLALSHQNPNYFKRIVALTFTLKAAAEMKERIVKHLVAMARGPMNSESEAMLECLLLDLTLPRQTVMDRCGPLLEAVLFDYGRFQALTIDKFTYRLVRSLGPELGLSSDFGVELKGEVLHDMAATAVMDKIGIDPKLTAVAARYIEMSVESNDRTRLKLRLIEMLKEMQREEFFFNQRHRKPVDAETTLKAQELLLVRMAKVRDKLKAAGSQFLTLCERHGYDVSHFKGMSTGPYNLMTKVANGQIDGLKVSSKMASYLADGNAFKTAENGEAVVRMNALVKEVEEDVRELAWFPFLNGLRTGLTTMALMNELKQAEREIRLRENAYTLHDFYTLLADHIGNDVSSFVFERLGNSIAHTLIDEFQDTSRLQWRVLSPLLVNGLSEGMTQLIVGDAKQSIYRFRGSEPELFADFRLQTTADSPLFEALYEEEELRENRRSAPVVVHFNNRFFREAAAQSGHENVLRTYAGNEQKIVKPSGGSVLIRLLEKDNETELSKVERCAQEAAAEVKKLRDDGANLGDITVLFRSNHHGTVIANALVESGIQVTTAEALKIENSARVNLLAQTLIAHSCPTDQSAAQHWLLLLKQCALVAAEHHSLSEQLTNNKRAFNQQATAIFPGLKNTFSGTSNLFELALALTNAYGFDTSDAYIGRFLDFVLEYTLSRSLSKPDFASYWADNKAELNAAAAGNRDAVKLMTIHKAKGLEFEHVVLMISASNQGKAGGNCWVEDENGVGELAGISSALLPMSAVVGTRHEWLKSDFEQKELLDELNVLYVACTRAVKNLRMVADITSATNHPLGLVRQWPEWDEELGELRIG